METLLTAPYTLVKEDKYTEVKSPTSYNVRNPLSRLMGAMEDAYFFAEKLHYYLADSIQFLFPFADLELYGPSGADAGILDPVQQDNKTDFQKQNIKDYTLLDTFISRGWVNIGGSLHPFVKISYTGGPDSLLSAASNHQLNDSILLWISIQGISSNGLIKVPYNENTHRYEVELWGYPDSNNLYQQLSDKGKKAMQEGSLVVRNDLITGTKDDFNREGLDARNMYEVAPGNTMHPLLPLSIELAWTDHTQTYWDSRSGNNHHYEFNMLLRGWDNFMQVGVSANPHGGIGFLHYRNLLSNYKSYSVPGELSRTVMPWMFDAEGKKNTDEKEEPFFATDYMDLHVLKADCGIGIHRHRDNHEIFFLLTGKAYMMTGDWYEFAGRERAFEIRTLLPGSFTLLKAGQLHSLMNALDTDTALLMFGGYD